MLQARDLRPHARRRGAGRRAVPAPGPASAGWRPTSTTASGMSMDTFKDRQQLEEIYARGNAPWEVWNDGRRGPAMTPARALTCESARARRPTALHARHSTCRKAAGAASSALPRRALRRHRNRLRRPHPLAHSASRRPVDVDWVVFSAARRARAGGAPKRRRCFSKAHARERGHRQAVSRTGSFPTKARDIKTVFEELKPDSIPISCSRTIATIVTRTTGCCRISTWNTFRDHFVLEYEIPKFDGDLGTPNCFVPLDEVDLRTEGRNTCETASAPSATSTGFPPKPSWA